LLVLLSPVLALGALAILATSGTPLLYRGERVGRGGHVFTMFKFRTLRPDAETRLRDVYGKELTERTRAEVTRFGRWLRFAQLDELPQLWNVVRGDMSVVGPRPVRPAFFEELVREIPQYWQRLVVRPGLTGFAQTRMGREESWAEKLAHDLEWIADRSLGLYLRTVVSTAWRVLRQTLRGRVSIAG
jgi:lipopolysaccharide/colanic/teichoic acid biosynthesis glycosyltransferase